MGLESWGEWASSWIETADINFRVFRDEMFNSGFGAGVVLPEGLKLLRSAAGYVYGGCGCKERELPPIAGGAPAIPPQFPPGPKSLLTNDEAAKLWDYVQNLETVVQGTTKSELAKATDTGPFLGAGYCVDYFRKLAPELPPNASPFELVAQALNNYASKGAGSNLLKGPVPNIWTFLGRAPPVP
jgi:hypothetical protein